MVKILQIVPGFPPTVDGLGDYAYQLGRQLRADGAAKSCYLVADLQAARSTPFDDFSVATLSVRSGEALTAAMEDAACEIVILHYVGYGYAQRGCPGWLLNGVNQWKQRHRESKLFTVFHELYASGPLWSSAFWLSTMQKQLCKSLYFLSDYSMTSTHCFSTQLNQWKHNKELITLPVFSNIGEIEAPALLCDRTRKLIVFGSRASRTHAYLQNRHSINCVCRTLDIDEIWDIGPKVELEIKKIANVKVTAFGKLPAGEVSQRLQQAVAGFYDYTPGYWAKSGIFAAYCAHGVLPVSAQNARPDKEGFAADEICWSATAENQNLTGGAAQEIATAAHEWYSAHSLGVCSTRIAKVLKLGQQKPCGLLAASSASRSVVQ